MCSVARSRAIPGFHLAAVLLYHSVETQSRLATAGSAAIYIKPDPSTIATFYSYTRSGGVGERVVARACARARALTRRGCALFARLLAHSCTSRGKTRDPTRKFRNQLEIVRSNIRCTHTSHPRFRAFPMFGNYKEQIADKRTTAFVVFLFSLSPRNSSFEIRGNVR